MLHAEIRSPSGFREDFSNDKKSDRNNSKMHRHVDRLLVMLMKEDVQEALSFAITEKQSKLSRLRDSMVPRSTE